MLHYLSIYYYNVNKKNRGEKTTWHDEIHFNIQRQLLSTEKNF